MIDMEGNRCCTKSGKQSFSVRCVIAKKVLAKTKYIPPTQLMPGEKTGKNPENYEAVFSKKRLTEHERACPCGGRIAPLVVRLDVIEFVFYRIDSQSDATFNR